MKTLLSYEALAEILERLQNDDFTRDDTTSLDGCHQEMISVDDDGDSVSVRAYYDEDGPRHSIERPALIYTYKVGDYTLIAVQDGDDIEISLDSNEFELDTDSETYSEIEDFIMEDVGEYDEYNAFEAVNWGEWTEQELYDEIISGLCYDEYLYIDGEYKGNFDIDEYPDEEPMSREDVASDLAANGCPDPW